MYNDQQNQHQPPGQWGAPGRAQPPQHAFPIQPGQATPGNVNGAQTQAWPEQSQQWGGSPPMGQTQVWPEQPQQWGGSAPVGQTQVWPEQSLRSDGAPGDGQFPNGYISQLEELSPWNADSRPLQTWSQSSLQRGNSDNINPAQWAGQSYIPGQISSTPASGQFVFTPPQNGPQHGQQKRNRLVILVSAATVAVLVVCGLLVFVLFNSQQNPSVAVQSPTASVATATPIPTDTPTPVPTDTPVPTPTPTTVPTPTVPVYVPPTPIPVTTTSSTPIVPTPTVTTSKSTPTPSPTPKPTPTPKPKRG